MLIQWNMLIPYISSFLNRDAVWIHIQQSFFAHRKMKFLALCVLLAAGSCLAGVSRSNTYSIFYNSLPDECKCVLRRPLDGRLYSSVCQYSVARWQTIQLGGRRVKGSTSTKLQTIREGILQREMCGLLKLRRIILCWFFATYICICCFSIKHVYVPRLQNGFPRTLAVTSKLLFGVNSQSTGVEYGVLRCKG
jgi:hypothetical protein